MYLLPPLPPAFRTMFSFLFLSPVSSFLFLRYESRNIRQSSSQYKRMNIMRPFISINRLQVHNMSNNMILIRDPVPP